MFTGFNIFYLCAFPQLYKKSNTSSSILHSVSFGENEQGCLRDFLNNDIVTANLNKEISL